MSTLGDRIKEKRIAAGFSADELAKRIGKNCATVYRYESGDVDIPVSVVGEIALALDASPAYLMGWEEEKPIIDTDDGLVEIAKVFTSLTPDNRAKLLELSRLYLAAQGSNE